MNGPTNVSVFNSASGTAVVGDQVFTNGLTFSAANAVVTGGTVTLSGTGVVINVATGTSTLASTVSGSGFSKQDTGTLVLSASNTFGSGTMAFGSGASGSVGYITLANGRGLGNFSTVNLFGNNTAVAGINLTGGITANYALRLEGRGDTAATYHLKNLSGNNTWAGNITSVNTGGAYLFVSDSGTLTLSGTQNSSVTSGRAFNYSGAGAITITGPILNGGTAGISVNKNGSGTLTLAGSNTSGALGSGTVTITNAGGNTRLLLGGSTTVANPIVVSGVQNPGTGNGVISVTSGTATITGPITLNNAPTATGGMLSTSAGATLEIASPITVTRASIDFSQRTGNVIMSGTGSTGWGIFGVTGTLSNGVTDALSTSANLLLGPSGAATYNLAGYDQTLAALRSATSATVVANSSTTSDSTLTIVGGTGAFQGTIADSVFGGTKKFNLRIGAGATLSLTGSNSFTGFTRIVDGTLGLGATNALAGSTLDMNGADVGALAFTGSNTTFDIGSSTQTFGGLTTANTITAAAIAVADVSASSDGGNALLILGQSNAFNIGALNQSSGGRSDSAVQFNTGLTNPALVLRGTDGSSPADSWTVGNVATFGGAAKTSFVSTADFSAGTLDAKVTTLTIAQANTGSQTGRTGVRTSAFTMGSGTLDVASVVVGRITGALAGSSTVILAGNTTYGGSTRINAGVLDIASGSLAGGVNGSGQFVKTGTGTLVLAGAGSLTGSTTVQGGVLRLANGAALATSAITPLAGGTLAITPYLQTTVGGLAPNAGGLTDVGSGLITAAAGDTNLDWNVDILDAADFLSTGLFDAGSYNPPPGSAGSIAAAPEPAVVPAALVAVGLAGLAIRRRRASSTA